MIFRITTLLLIITSTLFMVSCAADIRPYYIKKEGLTESNESKGRAMLEKAWKQQGFDKLSNHQTYSFKAEDTWRGLLGRSTKIWPNAKLRMEFKFEVGSFNGQVNFLEGKRASDTAGLQNWNYYESTKKTPLQFEKTNKKIEFGLAAFQYFTEMLDRMRSAEIIAYAGENEARGNQYDLVLCTWKTIEPHMENDQYVLWINKETGQLDFVQYTIREIFQRLPGYKAFHGNIEYSDYRNVDGIQIPFEQTVYAFGVRKKIKGYLHQLLLEEFSFDDFPAESLIIDPEKGRGGNFK